MTRKENKLIKLMERIQEIILNDRAENYTIYFIDLNGERREIDFKLSEYSIARKEILRLSNEEYKDDPKLDDPDAEFTEDFSNICFEMIWVCMDYGEHFDLPLEYMDEFLIKAEKKLNKCLKN